MAEKQKNAKKSRAHKESKGTARGARPVKLTELQKILISSGGFAHSRLRNNKVMTAAPKTRKTRADKRVA